MNVASAVPSYPYGSFDTPANDTTGIAGAIPVTGWALDSIEVASVGIWRERIGNEPTGSNGLVYVGDATFVAGVRPDVQALYPNAPLNYRAGWGYMLLTNFLPNSGGAAGPGNGTYKLHAIAVNKSGGDHSTWELARLPWTMRKLPNRSAPSTRPRRAPRYRVTLT